MLLSEGPVTTLNIAAILDLKHLACATDETGHFRVPFSLCIKIRLSAKRLIWK